MLSTVQAAAKHKQAQVFALLQGTRSGIAADPNLCPRRKSPPRYRLQGIGIEQPTCSSTERGPANANHSLLPWSMAGRSSHITKLPPPNHSAAAYRTCSTRLLQMIAKLEEHTGVASTTPQWNKKKGVPVLAEDNGVVSPATGIGGRFGHLFVAVAGGRS